MTLGTTKSRYKLLAFAALLAAACAALAFVLLSHHWTASPSSNSILVIKPYWYNGTWVFDDPDVKLKREPFVAGVPEMIDVLIRDIPQAKDGFRLTFSANPFPGHQYKLTWLRGDQTGNFYKLDDPPMEGWICPAMFKYYREAPKALYVKADALK
ncbi:MAG: hypothetical protein IT427_10670 [Pirellulales bacterium]|nr:hypothetical protein [Pirellulales bacterium]